MEKIKKILVANRGEIAIRIMRTCREMNIETVAIYSEADRTSYHVRYAHEAYYVGEAPSSESYLNIDNIINVAKKSHADAIHPGYGFLSENALFAQRCKKEGIIFIGPLPEVIETMGDKITARRTMINAGIPVVPGSEEEIRTEEEVVNEINRIGLPVIIKATAGGGGKGMRLVQNKNDILSSIRAARSEALDAFGNDNIYIEKYISSPHHIEFQILADHFGSTIHLFERECSIQRRHQKVIEETPSPLLTDSLRKKMGEHAVNAAKSVNYTGAGTIEFLVDEDLNFYFLEMNTRLQVEHPITEKVTGIDLVKQQILIAQGEKLKIKQQELTQKGHAIECRINAEDTQNNFLPNPGKIHKIYHPHGLGVRTDEYVYEGYEIPIYYDPMIAKIIVWGETREEAIHRMQRALFEYKITGIKTSINFLEKIMHTDEFYKGKYNTHFIEENIEKLTDYEYCSENIEDMVIISTYIDFIEKLNTVYNSKEFAPAQSRWKKIAYINHF